MGRPRSGGQFFQLSLLKILLQMKLNDTCLDPRPLPLLHMHRRCSALSNMSQMADERSYDIAVFAILVKFLT